MIYAFQLIILVVFVNNVLMAEFGFFQIDTEIVVYIFGIITFLLTVAAIFVIRSMLARFHEMQQYKINEEKYKHLKTQNELYRQHKHDLKNHLIVISGLLEENEYAKLQNYLNHYINLTNKQLITIETGVKELDVLLYAKMNEAWNHNIEVKFDCNSKLMCNHKHIPNLVSVFSNVLDNSIKACKYNQKSQLFIVINIEEDPLDYIFTVSNTYDLQKENYLKGKGVGIPIMNRIVKKYNGSTNYHRNNGIFEVKIEIPKHELLSS